MKQKTKINKINDVNYRLLVAIILTLAAPTIYGTFRIFLISNMPNEWGFNIASQIAWLNVIYEILQEGIILPLFFVFGAVVNQPKIYYQKVRQSIYVVAPIYAVIAIVIWSLSENLVTILNQKTELINQTVQYIKYETIAIPVRIIADITLIALITINAKKQIYTFIIIQVIIRIICDVIFISPNGLNLGIIGVAYSSIAIHALTAIVGIVMLFQQSKNKKYKINNQNQTKINWKKWTKVSLLSGAESGIRNTAFIIMILKLVNEVGESGTLWISNNFIWGWLLLPIIALGTLIKQDVAVNGGVIGKRFKIYINITAICCIIWILTMPAWKIFIQYVMGVEEYKNVLNVTMILIGFYVIFAVNNVYDSYLYGMGRTDLMLYQSIVVNGIYYSIAFVMHQKEIFVPTLNSIALLFGGGILIDFLVTLTLFYAAGYPRK